MKGLLLAGGHGTRLRPLTYTGNKHMLPIANKPMLMYGFDQMRASGIKEIGVVLGPIQEGIVDALGDGGRFGVRITYIDQPEPKGIAHAVLISRDFVGSDPFVVHLGDNLLKESIPTLAQEFRYFFRQRIFETIEKLRPSWRNELEITEAIQNLLTEGGKIAYHEITGWWKDTGRPEDILEANQLVLSDLKSSVKGTVEDGVAVGGNVELGEGSVARQGAALRGPVVIGENSEIGKGAYIGPYTSIGSKVRIFGAEIENSIVLDGAVIDCKERIVDSIIGKDSKILSNGNHRPSGRRFVVGESTFVSL